MALPQGDAAQIAGMIVTYDPERMRVKFDPDPNDLEGRKIEMDKADLSILIRYLNRVHGIM